MRKCKYCGFNNPQNTGKCLQCGHSLPVTIGEVKKNISVLEDVASGKWQTAGKKVAKGVVEDNINDLKNRANPLWWLKIKVFRAKRSCISCLIIIGIIVLLAFLGGIMNNFK